MDKICYLICAGERCALDFTPESGDFVIAVDGGYNYLKEAGIKPNLTVGDFDSLGFVPDGDVVRLDRIKDNSDTFAAIDEGFKRGYKRFKLYAALGGRLSHILFNVSAMNYIAGRGGRGEIIGDRVRAFTCATYAEIPEGGYMSVIPLTETAVVGESGCRYSGVFTLTRSDSLGLSNEPQKNAAVTVHSGAVLIILED